MLLINYNEIGLKKSNRKYFENKLLEQIKQKTRPFGLKKIHNLHKKYLLDYESEDRALSILKDIFGIHMIRIVKISSLDNREELKDGLLEDLKKNPLSEIKGATYGVFTKRINKKYDINSIEFSQWLGSEIGQAFPHWKVDLDNPQIKIECEIEKNFLSRSFQRINGPGGLSSGSGGKALLLLSGGLDSPVAGWLMAKRGLTIAGVHFHAPPYTSPMLTLKIEKLAKRLAYYQNLRFNLFIVDIVDILKELAQKIPRDYNVVMQRRIMFKIAEIIAEREGYQALITGDNLGQVASQTLVNLGMVNQAAENVPVFRPLIAYEKNQTIDIARKIETFPISIEPLEDCCTVFVAKHPVTKAKAKSIEIYENRLDLNELISTALEKTELKRIEFKISQED